ncbi:endosomal/lysosomal proton channel TMEM175 isoform X3 [Lutra lutra]|uniref:endosomal/lysosomal proton channel TMEM175 isoform X3 n=1 Tax=Lutra lutra TaxID=9657 RepID=UPI001FCFEC7E|nr:endosomal/lysosomal proton channel TMEM175 isoform X3 [Lutra lutra]
MSGPQTPEPALRIQGDAPTGARDEDAADGIQHSHRMLSFSDALLSIIATVMILPVTHTEISPEQVLGEPQSAVSRFDKSIQKLLATRIAVYLMTFLIVTVAWAAHTRLFQVVGKIDDTLALLNLACMMTITFLPFTFSLMVTFPEVPLGIFLFCMCVITIGAVQALIVVYAFHFPHLLNPQIESSAHRALYRQHILGIVLRGPALCFVAAGFSLFFYPLSYLLMAMVIFLPYVSKVSSWCKGRLVESPPLASSSFLAHPQAPRSPQLTAWSSSLLTCTNLSARSGWRPSVTGSTPSSPHSSFWTSGPMLCVGHPQRGQRAGPQGCEGEVPWEPGGSTERVRAALPGLLRLLRHGGPALVCPPLALPAHPQGHAVHGAAQHAVTGLRGRPPTGLPADLSLRATAARRAGERARQLRHHLPCQHLPIRHLDHGPAARGGDAAALGPLRGPGACIHVCQACAVPLCQPAGLRVHLLPQPVQHGHLPPHADRRALRLPAAASPRPPGPGPSVCHAGPHPASNPGRGGRTRPAPPCCLLAPGTWLPPPALSLLLVCIFNLLL